MARASQAAKDNQIDLFGAPAAPVYRPDLGKVRSRLGKLLGEARAAEEMPWEPAQLSLYRVIFPQMAAYLPAEEGESFRRAFDAELSRLDPEKA